MEKLNCEGCKFRQDRVEMVAPFVSGTIDWCRKFKRIADKRCSSYELGVIGKIGKAVFGFWNRQATEYEEHMNPKRNGASRESIIQDFVSEIDQKIAKGELTEKEARKKYPRYNELKRERYLKPGDPEYDEWDSPGYNSFFGGKR